MASHARVRSAEGAPAVVARWTRLTHRRDPIALGATTAAFGPARFPPRDADERSDAVNRADAADMTPPHPFPPARARAYALEDPPRSLVSESDVADNNIDQITTEVSRPITNLTAPPSTRSFAAMFAVSAPASALAARPAARTRASPRRALAVRAAVTTVDAPAEGSVALTRRDAVLGAAAASLGLLVDTRAARALDVGAAAPVFTLPATGGGTVALADVVKANKYTVLYFYNQDFSSGCSIEAERFNQALGDFKAKGAEVVGVSMDPMDKHEEFCSAKDLKFKLLSDNDGKVSEAYGADLKIPILGKFSDRQTFLIDSSGVVKGHWLERDGSMANVKTPAHTSQILEAIDKL